MSPGPGVAHPPHRLTQEVGGAAGGVGAALAQPGHQHVSGAGGDSQQWVIAPLAGVTMVSRPFLVQSVGLADRRIKVDSQGCVAGSRPGSPCPCQQLAAHPVQLADVAPAKARRKVPSVDGALTRQSRTPAVPPAAHRRRMQSPPASAEATSVIILSPVLARPAHHPGPGAAVPVGKDRGAEPGWLGGAGRHWPRGDHREATWMRSRWLRGSIYWALLFRDLFQYHYPRFRGAPFGRFRTLTRRPPSVDSG